MMLGTLQGVSSVLWSTRFGSERPNSARYMSRERDRGEGGADHDVHAPAVRDHPDSRNGSSRIAVNLTATAIITAAPARAVVARQRRVRSPRSTESA